MHMSECSYKYREISAELRASIQRGEYRDRLPSVRLLEELFSVNKRTVLRALQELTAEGFILANGNQGFFINHRENRRAVTDNIVVYIQNPTQVDNRYRPAPSRLESLMTSAGKRLISMSSLSPEICSMRSFWESLSADGVIFLNSSLTQQAASQLKLSGIPFVAANRMPREWGVNYVDFNHEGALNELFHRLILRHHKRIAMITPCYALHYFRDIFFSAYESIMSRYGVFDPELFCYPEPENDIPTFLVSTFRRLLDLQLPPTALYIGIGIDVEQLRALLNQAGIILPKNLEIYSYYSAGIWENDTANYAGLQYDYRELFTQLWELLQTMMENPARPPEGRLIPVSLIHQDGSPWTQNNGRK